MHDTARERAGKRTVARRSGALPAGGCKAFAGSSSMDNRVSRNMEVKMPVQQSTTSNQKGSNGQNGREVSSYEQELTDYLQ